jgi:hypothetical protein
MTIGVPMHVELHRQRAATGRLPLPPAEEMGRETRRRKRGSANVAPNPPALKMHGLCERRVSATLR